jgi:murein DD-endopeptidase MepM/ murein hydrolase activator NlpD
MVKGQSGHVLYGEMYPTAMAIGQQVKRGYKIGIVKAVLPESKIRPDIPNHSNAMLHLELYRFGTYSWSMWKLDSPRPQCLLNPTARLKGCIEC